MLFHTFKTQAERRSFGSFIKIQFCDMPKCSRIKELVSVDNIKIRREDSLYVHEDDDEAFFREYSRVFDCETYNNLETGVMDLCGINYYAPNLIDSTLEKLRAEKPLDCEVLAAWQFTARKATSRISPAFLTTKPTI